MFSALLMSYPLTGYPSVKIDLSFGVFHVCVGGMATCNLDTAGGKGPGFTCPDNPIIMHVLYSHILPIAVYLLILIFPGSSRVQTMKGAELESGPSPRLRAGVAGCGGSETSVFGDVRRYR